MSGKGEIYPDETAAQRREIGPKAELAVDLHNERFEILEMLGAGGMGVVYRARDRERDVTVALKALASINPAALYSFKREFRAVADLHHPNVITLYELFGRAKDTWRRSSHTLKPWTRSRPNTLSSPRWRRLRGTGGASF